MDALFRKKLDDLYAQLKAEDSQKTNRLERWRNLEPESALFIAMLIRSQQTRQLLEIGTSNGYSTLWFADALQTTHGQLTSLEIEPARTQLAMERLDEFHLLENARCLTTDAGDFLATAEPVYDLIFLDAERAYYSSYWPHLQRLLTHKKGTLLVVDNALSHQQEVVSFTDLIQADESMLHTLVPIGAGLLLVTHV